MRKKQSKKITKRKVKSKRKITKKMSRRRNPALGYINTSDNNKEALEIQGINSEPLLGGLILKFYLVGVEKSFDILLYSSTIDFIYNKLMILAESKSFASINLGNKNLGFTNISNEFAKNNIVDISIRYIKNKFIIELETDYVSPSLFRSQIRKLGIGKTPSFDKFNSSKYIITLTTDSVKLLKQLLYKRENFITNKNNNWYEGSIIKPHQSNRPSFMSGHIEDFKPSFVKPDKVYWDDFE